MSFVAKEWKDRLVEFAGRRKLTNVSTGEETTVDVSRAEGEVSQSGDAFSAANMNDLEQRIKDGFDQVNCDIAGVKFITDDTGRITGYTTEKGGADTVFPFYKLTIPVIQVYNDGTTNGSVLLTAVNVENLNEMLIGSYHFYGWVVGKIYDNNENVLFQSCSPGTISNANGSNLKINIQNSNIVYFSINCAETTAQYFKDISFS